MSSEFTFDYFDEKNCEQFIFYRVPKMVVKDEPFKTMSSNAKLVYGIMMDRLSLSIKNGWRNKSNGRVYIIYSIKEIASDLGISEPTAGKALRELDTDTGIGLIERERYGRGQPDRIYVKNFASIREISEEERAGCRIEDSRNKDSCFLEVKTFDPNNTELSKTDTIKTDHLINHIDSKTDQTDEMMKIEQNIAMVKKNINYDHHMAYDAYEDRVMFEGLYNLIEDVLVSRSSTFRINGADLPADLVKKRFLMLTDSNLEYVNECISKSGSEISNIRAYMLTALYNAPSTEHLYYTQLVHQGR